METNYFRCIPMKVFDTATLSGTYQSLNTTGFARDIKILKIYNAGTLGVTVSYDSVTDHDFFPAGATILMDLQANHDCDSAYSSGKKTGRQGQIIYGKGSAGIGNLYIIGFY